ncbi:MAG: glycosyltransferase [Bacillota bacterium]
MEWLTNAVIYLLALYGAILIVGYLTATFPGRARSTGVIIIVLTKNEEDSIERYVRTLTTFLDWKHPGIGCRLMVVDLGSDDRTRDIVARLAKYQNVCVVCADGGESIAGRIMEYRPKAIVLVPSASLEPEEAVSTVLRLFTPGEDCAAFWI